MSDTQSLFKEAEKLKDEGKRIEAVDILKKILEIDPNHVLSRLTISRLLTLLDRHEESVEHALKACEIDPNDAFHYTALSVAYQRAFAGTQDRKYIQLAEDAMARANMLS